MLGSSKGCPNDLQSGEVSAARGHLLDCFVSVGAVINDGLSYCDDVHRQKMSAPSTWAEGMQMKQQLMEYFQQSAYVKLAPRRLKAPRRSAGTRQYWREASDLMPGQTRNRATSIFQCSLPSSRGCRLRFASTHRTFSRCWTKRRSAIYAVPANGFASLRF